MEADSPLRAPLLVPEWHRRPLPTPAGTGGAEHWLLLVPAGPVGTALVEACAAYGATLSVLTPGEPLVVNTRPHRVLYAWDLEDPEAGDTAEAAYRIFHRLRDVAVALARWGSVDLLVVTDRAYRVTGRERLRPAAATALGPALVIGKETDLRARIVDVEPGLAGLAPALGAELAAGTGAAGTGGGPIAWRGRDRFVLTYQPRGHSEGVKSFRPGGTYLITGGYGGIGAAVARRVASVGKATLVLVGRRDPDVELVRRLRAAGATVLPFTADVGDRTALASVVARVRAATGRIDGVVHCAGSVDDVPLAGLDRAVVARVFGPKVDGTLALAELCPDAGFLALFSSVMTVSGAYGHGAYVAANSFLDAYAAVSASAGQYVVAIDCTLWGEVGMARPPSPPPSIGGTRGWLRTAEGLDLLERILTGRPGYRVVVCPDGVQKQIARAEARAKAAREAAAG